MGEELQDFHDQEFDEFNDRSWSWSSVPNEWSTCSGRTRARTYTDRVVPNEWSTSEGTIVSRCLGHRLMPIIAFSSKKNEDSQDDDFDIRKPKYYTQVTPHEVKEQENMI